MKDLAVLIPVFNDEPGLRAALESIRESDNSFTVVVVDDGSRDPISIDPAGYPFQVVVLRQGENGGIVKALNAGLEYIRGRDFRAMARLDAADLNLPERLGRQYRLLNEREELALVGSNAHFRNEKDGTVLFSTNLPLESERIRRRMVFSNCFIHPTTMVRLDRIPDTLRYQSRYPHIEDYVFYSAIVAKHATANIDEPLVQCTVREQGISRKNEFSQLFAGVCHHLDHPEPGNLLWHAYILKKLAYMVIPFPWRNFIKKRLRFVLPQSAGSGRQKVRVCS